MMALFCKQCGAQLGDSAKFCPACGTTVEAAQPQGQPGQPAYGQQPGQPAYGQQPEQPAPGQQPGQPAYGQPPGQPAQTQQQPPAPQYGQAAPPPQYGQAAPPPKKGLSKKLLLIIIIAAAAVVAVLILVNALGNQEEPKAEDPSPAPPVVTDDDEVANGVEPDPVPEPADPNDEDEPEDYQEGMTAENPSVFDFSDLNGEDFPRGMWSVNQLATMYGAPEETKADYMRDYGIVFVQSVHKNLTVYFAPESVEFFSFYNENLEDGEYTMYESDKDIEFQILSVRVQSASANLPYDILIGQSTKAQIVAAYGEYPAFLYQDEEYGTDEMIYNYAYYDEHGGLIDDYGEGYTGGITYNFGENGVLLHVDVQWEYFDL